MENETTSVASEAKGSVQKEPVDSPVKPPSVKSPAASPPPASPPAASPPPASPPAASPPPASPPAASPPAASPSATSPPAAKTPSTKSPASSPAPQAPVEGANRSPGKASAKSDRISIKSADQKSPKSVHSQNKDATELNNIGTLSDKLTEHVGQLTNLLTKDPASPHSPVLGKNIEKIANMGKILTNEANALRDSIKSLSDDIAKTKQEMNLESTSQDVGFPYHLFLVEIVVNKIHMKCECFEVDLNNLVVTATFLGKQPIVLFDSSVGKVEDVTKLNAGKSTLFAMTYDKICAINDFVILLQLTKQPPCSTCITRIGETRIDLTSEFVALREELCRKWSEEQPNDNISCTTSTPLTKNMYYLSCGKENNGESIGVIEVSVRMSFLGKEITTAFCAAPKTHGASFLLKQDNGMTMYSCQKVEMDEMGKVLLDEELMNRKRKHHSARRSESPASLLSSALSSKSYEPPAYSHHPHGRSKYDEIFTKVNANELKIRVPKSTKVERIGKYEKMQELCECESTPYNTGDQIQFGMPPDFKNNNTYSSNLTYTYKGSDKSTGGKDNRIINVTPTNCPLPVDMEKVVHPQKDVFILKIGKKMETSDKKTDLEIELVTPKAPPEKTIENSNTAQQCSSPELKAKESKKGKGKDKDKKKGKKGGKGKKKK